MACHTNPCLWDVRILIHVEASSLLGDPFQQNQLLVAIMDISLSSLSY